MSDGIGPMARRTRCGGVRTASQTLRAPLSANCTAMSAAELPAPTTSTSRPRNGHALRKSAECTSSPVKPVETGPRRNGGRAIAAGGQHDRGRGHVAQRGVGPPAVRLPARSVSPRSPARGRCSAVARSCRSSRPCRPWSANGQSAMGVVVREGATENRWCSAGNCRSGCATTPREHRPFRRPAPKLHDDVRVRARRPGRRARLPPRPRPVRCEHL